MQIASCTAADLDDWARLRATLWPDERADELRAEAEAMLGDPDAIALLARMDGQAAGFAEATLRRDYVNGCETSPVAFLEGIFVNPEHRHQHVAQTLTEHVAEWGRAQGCTEFASDALLENTASHAFHAAIGFEETERVVYFRKAL